MQPTCLQTAPSGMRCSSPPWVAWTPAGVSSTLRIAMPSGMSVVDATVERPDDHCRRESVNANLFWFYSDGSVGVNQ